MNNIKVFVCKLFGKAPKPLKILTWKNIDSKFKYYQRSIKKNRKKWNENQKER